MFNYSRVIRSGNCLVVCGVATSFAMAAGNVWDGIDYETTVMWESRYVDSGREDLDESGIASAEWIGST